MILKNGTLRYVSSFQMRIIHAKFGLFRAFKFLYHHSYFLETDLDFSKFQLDSFQIRLLLRSTKDVTVLLQYFWGQPCNPKLIRHWLNKAYEFLDYVIKSCMLRKVCPWLKNKIEDKQEVLLQEAIWSFALSMSVGISN